MSLTTRVLVALLAGMTLGIVASLSGEPLALRAAGWLEPIGTLFINALRMTVIPLVVGSLVVGVASSPDPRTIGRVGVSAVVLFVATLVAGTMFAILVAPPLIRLFPIDDGARAALGSAATASGDAARTVPTLTQWLVELVPVNPLKAAADGAMLPLIVFSILFGLALAHLTPERRDAPVRFFDGVARASLVLVQWVLDVAPIGVFALAVPLASRMGASAAGALAYYVVIVVAVTVAFCVLVLYPLAALGGRVPMRQFARAALPPQAVAFSARSSLASLPAMMESARSRLRLRDEIVSFMLPMAASTFRPGGAVGLIVGVVFLAHLYGETLGVTRMVTIGLTVILSTFSVPGIPGGSILIMAPVLMAAGIDLTGLGILFGVDTIPDMFRTVTNVTGDMATATVTNRIGSRQPDNADA